jgi:hypothetical protein
MLGDRALGLAKLLLVVAIAAVSIKAVRTLSSGNVEPPRGNCPCQCPYYYMCSGPPACVCIEPEESPSGN